MRLGEQAVRLDLALSLGAALDFLIGDRRGAEGAAEKIVAALVSVGLGCRIVSHESIIAGLKELVNQGLLPLDVDKQIAHLRRESDRAALILLGAVVEDFLLEKLKERMPDLNRDEQARLFGFEGPCGSFSNKLRIGHALGLFSRSTRRKLEVVKELRNAAAHAHGEINFDTPAVREAMVGFVTPAYREPVSKLPALVLRRLFERICADAILVIADDRLTDFNPDNALRRLVDWATKQLDKREASPEKSSGASRRTRPAKGKTGTRPRSPPKASPK